MNRRKRCKKIEQLKKLNIDTIPTAYILLDGGSCTSVSNISNTNPLNMNDKEDVLSHALAGQFMGNKLIYFDCGSPSFPLNLIY